MGKPVVHFEFWSEDPEKISEFYSRVFDWSVQHIPEMNYRLVDTGGQGGIKRNHETTERTLARQPDLLHRCG